MGKIGELPRILSLFVFLKGQRLLFVRLLLSRTFYKRQDLLKMSWVEIKTAYNLEDFAGKGTTEIQKILSNNKTSNLLHAKMGSDLPWFTSITGFTTRNLVSINHSAILTALIHKNVTLQFMIE
ncbi:hypothetical protein E2320_017551, partial [Naja naja]